MATFKLTDSHRALIRERRAAGFSLRAVAQWLEATEGVAVTPKAIKDALDRDAAREAQPQKPSPPKVTTQSPESSDSTEEKSDDAADYELISRVIAELDADIDKARTNGNVQGQATLERLRLDAVERRRKLRPPPPPAEVDAELLVAGERAAAKLREYVDKEVEALGKARAPRPSARG